MKRKLLIFGLAAGTVLGFGHGFRSLAHCHRGHEARRAAFEDHVADVCVDAALRASEREVAYVEYTPPEPVREARGCDHGQADARGDTWIDARGQRWEAAHEGRRRHRRHRRHHPRRPHEHDTRDGVEPVAVPVVAPQAP